MRLCFDAEDDEKLARGWPNLIAPIDGGARDKVPAKSGLAAHSACDPIHFTEWPRKTLERYLRIEAAALGAKAQAYDARQAQIVALAEKASTIEEPLDRDEALAGVHAMFEKSAEIYPFQTYSFVYGVETIAGTDAVLDAIARDVESISVAKPSAAQVNMVGAMPFLALRASANVSKRAREIATKVLANAKNDELREALDLAVNGAAAVARATGKYVQLDGGWGLIARPPIEYADDEALVRDHVKRAQKNAAMSVRVAWLGGSEVLEGLSQRKWPAKQMPAVVRDFGMIRSPAVVDLMLSLVGKTSVKDAPLQWFRKRAEFAAPILAKNKSDAAKSILRQLK